MTTTVSHVVSQIHRHLVDEFLWQLFTDGLLGDFQLILALGWSLCYFYSMARYRHDSPVGQTRRLSKPLILLSEPGTIHLHFYITLHVKNSLQWSK